MLTEGVEKINYFKLNFIIILIILNLLTVSVSLAIIIFELII